MKKKTIIITILVIAVAIFFISKGTTTGNVTKDTEVTKILLSGITEQAKWYEYDSGETKDTILCRKGI